MARRFRRRTRSQAVAQLRIPFRNVREVAGTSIAHPQWPSAAPRVSPLAIVIHVAELARVADYTDTIEHAGVPADLYLLVSPEAGVGEAPPVTSVITRSEMLVADGGTDGVYQLTALVNSGRLTGYRTVVRHVDRVPSDLARFQRLELGTVDALVHQLDRAAVFVPPSSRQRSIGRDVTYRVSQLFKRINSRFRDQDLVSRSASIATVAIRGAVLEFLRPLRIDHQDYHIDFAKLIHEGQSSEYLQPAEADLYAERAVECALLALIDISGLSIDDLSTVETAPDATVPAGTGRARAWAVYHARISPSLASGRGDSWLDLGRALPMFLGQQMPPQPTSLGHVDPLRSEDRARQLSLARSAGISGFLLPTAWSDGRFDIDPFVSSLGDDEDFPWAPLVQHSATATINPNGSQPLISPWSDAGTDSYPAQGAALARMAARPGALRVDGHPVIVVQDLAATTMPILLLESIRAAVVEASGVQPWIAIVETRLTTSRPGGPTVPEGLDGVIQLPPANVALRQRLRIGGRFAGFTGPVLNLTALESTAVTIEARTNENIIPGALVGFDTTPSLRSQGTVGYNWNIASFRRMLDNAVRSVAWRDESRRIVLINSWNGWVDTSQLEPGHHRGEAYLSVVRDTLHL